MNTSKKYIKQGLALMCLILSAGTISAQQDAMFTQYFFNPLSVNSGYAGSHEALNVNLLAREQWVGIDGRPRTQTLTIHSPLANDKLALGFSIVNDKVGPVKNTALYGDFAYRMQVSSEAKLAFGIKAGLNFHRADFLSLQNTDVNDISFQQNVQTKALPNFGFGAYYWTDRYFVGLSTPKLIENDLTDSDFTGMQTEEKRHFFLMGGYVFDLSNAVKLKPTTMIKYVDGAPVSVDLTANFLFYERLWVGGMYRFGDAVGLLASYQITEQLRAGYAYDFTLSELSGYNSGSHELMISYDFMFGKDKTMSPRYF